jgi:hypothetical protein
MANESLETKYNELVDKLVQLKAAMVRNPFCPGYTAVKQTYWEVREKAEKIAVKLGVDPVAV